MQPFQEAEKEIVQQRDFPLKIAGSVAAGATAFGRIAPFLSRNVPASIGLRGISKAGKSFSNFIKKSTEHGFEEEEIRDFLRSEHDEFKEQSEKVKKPAKSLFMQMLGGTEPPKSLPQHLQFQIDAIQNIANKFEKEGKTIESPEVKKLTQRLKNILQGKGMLSGSDMQPQQGASMMQQGQGMGQPMQPQQMGAMQQQGMQQPMQGGQQGMGQGQQALMAILQKIQAQRGA